MFTLQILDRGQTFFQPLEDRALLLGSAESADLRLHEEGVAPEHARVEPAADGSAVLSALGSAPVLLNGQPVTRAELALGDRIELGCAVLVVGRAVSRPARPEDVLAEGAASSRPRARRGQRGSGRGIAVLVALLAVAGIAWLAYGGGGGDSRPDTLALERLRRQGDFARARAELQRLRDTWAAEQPERQAQLDGEAALVAAVEQAVANYRTDIFASQDGYAAWSLRLQEEEHSGYEPASREAARIVRSSLTDLMAQRPHRPGQSPVAVAPGEPEVEAAPPPPTVVAPTVAEDTSPSPTVDLAVVLQDADRLLSQGLYSQSIDTLESAISSVARDDAAPLRTLLATARLRAEDGLQQLLQQASGLGAQDKLADAINLLTANAHRFTSAGGTAAIGQQLDQLRQRLTAQQLQTQPARPLASRPTGQPAAADEARARVTLESLRNQLDLVRTAESAGDFVAAEQLLRQGADVVAMRDPGYAERMRQRADEFTLLAELHRATAAALQGGRAFDVALRSGIKCKLQRIEQSHLLVTTADGELEMSWLDLDGASVQRLVADGKLPPRAWLGAAVLCFQNGEGTAAEALLAKALRAEARLKPEVDLVLARGRGDGFDPRGYVLEKDGFTAARTVEARKTAQKLATRLDSLLRSKDTRARDAFVADLLAQGPEALEPVVLLFRQEFRKQVEQLSGSPLRKQLEKLSAQRDQLDAARREARSLIYDEVRYFYPFRPPAVSGEKAAEYAKVQAEVDRLVANVRTIWKDDRIKVKVPASLQLDLDRLDWVAKVLTNLGDLDATALSEVEWARALPPGDKVDLQNYCRTPSERDQYLEWQAIAAFNEKVCAQVPSATREQLGITNDYRVMFHHRPLALNLKLNQAAVGHADEMSKLGYFSHFSPTPGRSTPFDRIKLAGYDQGVSENIALHDGAQGAHNGWTHSSGHHRNLLNPDHTEIGVAGQGRYWVQCFGRGREYLKDPLFTSKAH